MNLVHLALLFKLFDHLKVFLVEFFLFHKAASRHARLVELSAADKHCVQANQARSYDQDQAKDVHDVLRCKV